MTGAQPDPIHEQVTQTQYGNDTGFAAEAEVPAYAGDMPDDPEEARTYRPGEDEQDRPDQQDQR